MWSCEGIRVAPAAEDEGGGFELGERGTGAEADGGAGGWKVDQEPGDAGPLSRLGSTGGCGAPRPRGGHRWWAERMGGCHAGVYVGCRSVKSLAESVGQGSWRLAWEAAAYGHLEMRDGGGPEEYGGEACCGITGVYSYSIDPSLIVCSWRRGWWVVSWRRRKERNRATELPRSAVPNPGKVPVGWETIQWQPSGSPRTIRSEDVGCYEFVTGAVIGAAGWRERSQSASDSLGPTRLSNGWYQVSKVGS